MEEKKIGLEFWCRNANEGKALDSVDVGIMWGDYERLTLIVRPIQRKRETLVASTVTRVYEPAAQSRRP
jgi:hypothetical protein